MFECKAVMFLYAVSPVHMGAGNATGFIDNPIQRERHTQHPCFAGSGIKGAVRHQFELLGGDKSLEAKLFGPDSGSNNLHAGAVSFGDAQLVAFPVRCTRQSFVYATSPQTLARTKRLVNNLAENVSWEIPQVEENDCIVLNRELIDHSDRKLRLEAFEYKSRDDADVVDKVRVIAEQIAKLALSSSGTDDNFFFDKFRNHLVVLSDTDFSFFVENATVVEPHVRIDDVTGTAAKGALFYTENLPPESLLVAPLLASSTRAGGEDKMEAEQVLCKIKNAVDGKLIQFGGDATTGRGLVLTRVMGG